MLEATPAVETTQPAATETNGAEATPPAAPAEETVKLAELAEVVNNLATELEKTKSDAENYKQGMLVAKQKLKDSGFDDEPEDDERIAKAVAKAIEPLMERFKPVEDTAVATAQKKIAELQLALSNRSQISNTTTGTSVDDTKVVNHFFSESQLAELKARGLDPDKVKANLTKYKGQI